jgi:hypothetical protein
LNLFEKTKNKTKKRKVGRKKKNKKIEGRNMAHPMRLRAATGGVQDSARLKERCPEAPGPYSLTTQVPYLLSSQNGLAFHQRAALILGWSST